MSLKEKWIKEFQELENNKEIEEAHYKLFQFFESFFKGENMKVILTSRKKSISSFKEKIKRNRMDQIEDNFDKNVLEVLDDIIGFRIVCMKISDEEKVSRILFDKSDYFLINNIDIRDSIIEQPRTQKNGYDIYRIKGIYDSKWKIEIQIKSLANLFWGEMEHLLFYKNNNYIMNNEYYVKEINSIYSELSNIDNKLSYMEDTMLQDNVEKLDLERKDIFQRFLYLNTINKFYAAFEGEYLDNNHILYLVSEILFEREKPGKNKSVDFISEELNKKLTLYLDFIVDKNKYNFSFDEFMLCDFEFDKEMNYGITLFDVFNDTSNGWWLAVILLSIFYYIERVSDENPHILSLVNMKTDFCRSISSILDLLELGLFREIAILKADYKDNSLITSYIETFENNQIKWLSEKKETKFASKNISNKYAKDTGIIIKNIIKLLLIANNEKSIEKIEELAEITVNIVSSNFSKNKNIIGNIKKLQELLVEIDSAPNRINQNLYKNTITIKDFIDFIEEGGI